MYHELDEAYVEARSSGVTLLNAHEMISRVFLLREQERNKRKNREREEEDRALGSVRASARAHSILKVDDCERLLTTGTSFARETCSRSKWNIRRRPT